MVVAQDHDASAGAANTDAPSLRGGKLRAGILGLESLANLSTRRWPGVLCLHGAKIGGSHIRGHGVVHRFEFSGGERRRRDDVLGPVGSRVSITDRNPVPRRIHRSGRQEAMALAGFVFAIPIHFDAVSKNWNGCVMQCDRTQHNTIQRDDRYKEYTMYCNCDLGRSVGQVQANLEVPLFI